MELGGSGENSERMLEDRSSLLMVVTWLCLCKLLPGNLDY